MEFEPWMLLVFPLFFGMGWLAARIDIKQLVDESSALPRSYFQGLNFLLNEQQDKAIDAFIEVVQVDPQTVELHFALGSLFRRRGEVDRALRMHLNLVERADLDDAKRQQALFELAQDYLKAGILDRAEELFQDLQQTTFYAKPALDFLLEIYQKEQDWLKAIEVTQQLSKLTGEPHQREAAFFYCELAAGEIAGGQLDAARAHLNQALEANPKSVRASMMLGDMESAAGNHAGAIEIWQHVEQQPQYLPLVAERLLTASQQSGRGDEGIALLQKYLVKHHSLDLVNVLFNAILKRDGAEAAYEMVRDELERNPTLLGLDKLLEARLLDQTLQRRGDVEMVKNLVHQRTRALAMYRCTKCGFKARQFYGGLRAGEAVDQ